MSIEAMSCAWHYSKQTSSNLFVLIALADYADENGVCWPSLPTLAKKCRLSVRSVSRSIGQLIESGELVQLRIGAGRLSSRYRINLDQLRSFQSSIDNLSTHVTGVYAATSPVSTEPSIESSLRAPIVPKGDERDLLGDLTESVNQVKQKKEMLAFSIYQAYPKKVAKPKAIAAILKAMKKNSPDYLLERTQLYASTRNGDIEYCPHPATWFNQEQFNDDPSTWRPKSASYNHDVIL